MNCIKKIFAKLFERALYILLITAGWKRKIVYANLQLTGKFFAESKISECTLYKNMLKNLCKHVSEILFALNKFKQLPKNLSEYPYKQGKYIFEIDNANVIKKMRCGGIFLTAHYGNYESMGPWLCKLGCPLKASYIKLKPKWLNNFVHNKIRSVNGNAYSVNATTPRQFLKLLDNNELFCLLADQDCRTKSAKVYEFLNEQAYVNPLPNFLLKHKPQTKVFVSYLEETKNNRIILHALELTKTSDIAKEFNIWLEKLIKQNPELWYGWTHRRFFSTHPEIYR